MLEPWFLLLSVCVSLALSVLSLIRCYLPPQKRDVLALTGRVEDLEFAYDEVSKRMTKRAKAENMDKARAAHVERSERRDKIEQEAEAILATAASARAPQQTSLLPADDAAARAALRARVLGKVH